MATEILVKQGTALAFKLASYSPTAVNDIDPAGSTTVDLTLSSIAAAAAKNSDKVDLGATRANAFSVVAAIEWFAAVTAGGKVSFYWSPSNNATASDGNPGSPDGVDGAYTGDGGGTVAESVRQMQFIGTLTTTDLVGVQMAKVGEFSPQERYGQLIVVNNSSATLCGTDDIESAIVITPIIDESQ